jgi:hypothetical protein
MKIFYRVCPHDNQTCVKKQCLADVLQETCFERTKAEAQMADKLAKAASHEDYGCGMWGVLRYTENDIEILIRAIQAFRIRLAEAFRL